MLKISLFDYTSKLEFQKIKKKITWSLLQAIVFQQFQKSNALIFFYRSYFFYS